MKSNACLMWNIVLLTIVVLLFGCGNPGSQTENNGGQEVLEVDGVSDTEILFGAHTDLSGPIALYGVESVNGVNMRFDEANATGGVHGRTIRFIAEDSQYIPQESIRIVNKLIESDKIFAMLMAMGTPNNLNVMDKQFEAGVPNLFPFTGSIKMAEPYRKLMFTQRGIYYYEMRAAVKHFVEERGRSKPCVAYINNDYGQEIYDGARDEAEAMGLEIVAAASHDRTETEFTAAVLRLRDAGCDLVLMGTVVIDTIGILEAAQELGWDDVDWVGNNAASGSVVAENESGSGEGYFAFFHMAKIYPDTEEDQDVVAWYNEFETRYGRGPDIAGMEGYRAADLVIKALEAVGREITREKFIAALESLGTYEDIFGYTLQFSEDNHNGVRESILAQVQNRRWVLLDKKISINM